MALYLTDHFGRLRREEPARRAVAARAGDRRAPRGERRVVLQRSAPGGRRGYPAETVDALWDLVWKGQITNDTFHALRAFTRPPQRSRRRGAAAPPRIFRSRRVAPPSAEGRWSLVASRGAARVSPTEWSTATAQQLLSRYGVVTREVAAAEGISGGFSAVYDVLKALEDAGRIRRGYFVGGVGATQFALPAALDLLRSLREPPDDAEVVALAATDPGQPLRHAAAVAGRSRAATPAPPAKASARQAPHHAQRRIAGDPGERRARRLHQPRRAPAAGLPSRRRAGAVDGGARGGRRGSRSSPEPRDC